MYIAPVNLLYGYKTDKAVKLPAKQDKNKIQTERTIEYSLWNSPQISFSSKRRKYSSEIPSKYEKPDKFKIARIPNLTCPACGQKILTRSQYTRFLSMIRSAKEEDYIEILSNYEQFMCPTERKVFRDIKKQAKKINANGQTPHINEIVKSLREIKLPELEKIQLDKLEDMRDALAPLPKSEKIFLNKEFDVFSDIILNVNKKAPFRRKIFIEAIKEYNISNPEVKKDLVEIAESFPSSEESACAWIVKNAGKDKQGNDRSTLELVEKLVGIASTSTDHILARNIELNHDDITNYMAMHKGCNSEKTDKSFNDWFMEDPENRQIYLRKYFRDVKKSFEHGRIKDKKYRDYIKDCVLNIYNLSDGLVDFRQEFCPDCILEKTEA